MDQKAGLVLKHLDEITSDGHSASHQEKGVDYEFLDLHIECSVLFISLIISSALISLCHFTAVNLHIDWI